MLSDALSYAARGWRVIPLHTIKSGPACTCGRAKCGSSGKHPRTQHGCSDATTDTTQIKAWWKQWPNSNVGIATGRESGLVVLDVDVGGENSLHALEELHEPMPDTVESHTGGGGRHLLFKHPGNGQISNKVGLAVGLDVRADGGYIVAPPSLHQSGKAYIWEVIHGPEDLSVAPLPKWLRDELCAPEKKTPIEGLLMGVSEGERNDTAAKLAGKYLALGLGKDEAMALLATWNSHNTPPLTPRELEGVVTSIARRELLKRGDEPADRDTILRVLNERLHIPLEDIIRVAGSEPVYHVIARGRAVELTAKQIGNQMAFRNAMIAVAEVVPTKIGSRATPGWDHYLQLMLNVARHVDPGPEATNLGQLRACLQAYLEVRKPKDADEESVLADDPRRTEGGVLVNLPGVRAYLLAEGSRPTPQRLAQLFGAAGFERKLAVFALKAVSGTTRRAMWTIPTEYLDSGGQ